MAQGQPPSEAFWVARRLGQFFDVARAADSVHGPDTDFDVQILVQACPDRSWPRFIRSASPVENLRNSMKSLNLPVRRVVTLDVPNKRWVR